ncbi:ATP-grasp fold amidoligase family protein [Butyrivibrio fibrisolvens]|uniref:ATP-grasp fold amidoligase family protein n=1 Tax=Butyrivibrio fibrisolvens TaxID=831 RepID=UPI0020BE58E5|nr:ATP-grasp fold amidoligase family protein [Butyrivibrio fibrisolvens]
MNNKVNGELVRIKEGILRFSSEISPELNTQLRFLDMYGHTIDLKNPKSFSEKISWLKINEYSKSDLVAKCSDKYTVRDYVIKCGLGTCLNELIGAYKNVTDVPWEDLPDSFVLKWNFGSGYNFICPDKTKVDLWQKADLLNEWGKKKYWRVYSELQYKNRSKYLLCEKYLLPARGHSLLDYKIYCFSGLPKAILIIDREDSEQIKASFMTVEWDKIEGKLERYKSFENPEKPINLKQMVEAASILSKGFPFVRVDFYDTDHGAIFGEMTFTPHGGIYPSETPREVMDMGELLIIDNYLRNRQ